MREFITKIAEATRIERSVFWFFVVIALLSNWFVVIYTNSRFANPVCPDFKKQNPVEVKKERRGVERQLKQIQYLMAHPDIQPYKGGGKK